MNYDLKLQHLKNLFGCSVAQPVLKSPAVLPSSASIMNDSHILYIYATPFQTTVTQITQKLYKDKNNILTNLFNN